MKPWTITFEDRTWTDEQASTAHAVAVAELIGDSWDAVSPWTGPKSLAAWLTVLVASEPGWDLEKALRLVYALPISELGGCLTDRAAPTASTVTSTTTAASMTFSTPPEDFSPPTMVGAEPERPPAPRGPVAASATV